MTSVVLTQSTQIVHAADRRKCLAVQSQSAERRRLSLVGLDNPQGIAALNTEVTRQAQIIGYVNDFKLLFIVSLLMMPLLLLMRGPAREPGDIHATVTAH